MKTIFLKIITAVFGKGGFMVIAFLSALLLWYYGYLNNDPVETKTYKFDLSLRYADLLPKNDKYLRNADTLKAQEITVKVRTSKKVHISLQDDFNDGRLSCYVDFSVSHLINAAGNVYTNVQFDMPTRYDNDPDYMVDSVSISPMTVLAEFDKIEEKTLPVRAHMSAEISTDPNFSLSPFVCDPDKLTVRGPSIEINRVTAIEVPIAAPLTDITSPGSPNEYTVTARPRALDRNGLIVESDNITFLGDTSDINVAYSVIKSKEIPVIAPDIYGEPADGFALNPITPLVSYEPKTVWIKGAKEDVDAIVNIKLDTIDVSSLTQYDSTIRSNLRKYLSEMNNRLEFVNVNNTEVVVELSIEPVVEKEFHFYTSRLNIVGIDANTVDVPVGTLDPPIVVRGVASLMDEFNLYSDVTGTVNLASLHNKPPGEYTFPVTFTIKDGFTITSDAPVIVVSIPDNAADEKDEEDEEEVLP